MTWIERPVGIDLGTTNSCTAMLDLDGQRLMLAEDHHGRTIVPSVVGLDADGETVITGFRAWHRRGLDPEPVQSIKRKMGLDQQVALSRHRAMSPTEVSAEILRAMRAQMASYLERHGRADVRLQRAVVTVPAYFDAPQIDATRQAAERAGLDVLGLLQEPTAACMYVVWKRDLGDGNFLVYDLGGGTFDVSVIRCLYGEYQVLGIHGDNFLGGDDFDRRLAEHFRAHLVERGYSLDLDIQNNDDDRVRFLLLTRIAREVKEALSSDPVQYVARRDLFRDHDGTPVTLELELSRDQWERLMGDLIDSTIRCCHAALARAQEQANISLADIDHVVLVGGSTRVPLVQQRVRAAFCGEGKSKAEAPIMEAPDSCVALGAAIHAGNLGGARVGDDDLDLRVHITSPLATARDQLRLVGQLAGDGAAGAQAVMLETADGASLAVDSLDDTRRFKLTNIPLLEEGPLLTRLALLDQAGATLAALPLTLHRVHDLRRTGSALSNPTVLAKDIYLEVNRQGRLERQLLLARGRSLPAEGAFRFYTGDQSGAVLLTLLQNRFPISTLHLDVPDSLTVGTPVGLTVAVDEKMVITASGEVAGQSFWAQIEPPPPRALRDWSEVERLLDRAERTGAQLWGHEAYIYREEAPFLISSIREAVRTDPDKLVALVGRLEQLLENLRGDEDDLSPGFDRFSHLLDDIRRIALRGDALMGYSFDDWQRRLHELESKGREAFDARDQRAWSRAYTQAQALFESVHQEESRFMRADSAEYIQALLQRALRRVTELRARIDDFVLPQNPETRRLRQHALDAIAHDLEHQVEAPLRALVAPLESTPETRAELERLNQITRSLEKRFAQLPSLGVVVSD